MKIFFTISILFLGFATAAQTDDVRLQDFQSKQKIGFVANKGQVVDQDGLPNYDVAYLLKLSNLNVQLRSDGFSYDTYVRQGNQKPRNKFNRQDSNQSEEKVTYKFHRVDVEFVGSNKSLRLVSESVLPGQLNYYSKTGDLVTSHAYEKVIYQDLYNGIDLVFKVNQTCSEDAPQVEYDFVVHPGADPSLIKLRFDGQQDLKLKNDKTLVFGLQQGEFTESIPLSFEVETNKTIQVGYNLDNSRDVSFNIAAYDQCQTLVIDPTPTLVWGTYFGGSLDDEAYAVVQDASGNIYVTGYTESTGLATGGSHQVTKDLLYDAFVMKLAPGGTMIWATYYGGNDNDYAYDIAIDASLNVFVAGETYSCNGISTTGAHQETCNTQAFYDAFLVKFNSNGVRQFGTYYAGDGTDAFISVECDATGNVLLTGVTDSPNNISLVGAHQVAISGVDDSFVVKFNGLGVRQWATYYGGTLDDYGKEVTTDASGNVFVVGQTFSTANISTAGAHQTILSGDKDGFAVKFNSLGVRQWGTYYGGTASDQISTVKVHTNGDVYLSGYTYSPTGISTTGSYQTALAGTANYDAFLAKLNTSGVRQWGTYFGAADGDEAFGITLDGSGDGYLVGNTLSSSGFASTGSFQPTYGGGTNGDGFIAKFTSGGSFSWASYFGGSGDDYAQQVSLNGTSLVIAGSTSSTSGVASVGGFQSSYGGGTSDAFVTKFDISTFEPTNQPTNLVFTNITSTSYAFSFTAAVAGTTAPDGYIGIRKIGSPPTGVPVDGTTYVFPNPIGDGETNFVGTGTSYTQSGATASTAYHFAIYSYTGSGASINYKPVSPLTGSVTTLASGGTTITSINPTSGLIGASVTITGTGFSTTAANNTVRFNGTLATITGTPTTTSITATVPAGATTGPITVVVAGQTGTSSSFTVLATLASEPTNSPTNLAFSNITTTGYSFSFSDAVAGTTAPDGYIGIRRTGAAPTGVPVDGVSYNVGDVLGDGAVRLKGLSGGFSESDGSPSITYFFTIYSYKGTGTSINYKQVSPLTGSVTTLASGSTTITSINPTSGLIGSSVTITGTGFSTTAANNTVRFNGTLATITGTPTTTSITATVPAGATTGFITVVVAGQTGTSATFTVTTATPPTIASFLPISGTVGTSVTLTGANFSTIASNNIVKFNGVTAVITGTPTATSIVTTVPAGATTGKITVEVSSQTGTSLIDFTVNTVTLAIEPTNQPTALTFSSVTNTSYSFSFTAAAAGTTAPDGYIGIRKSGTAPTGVPVDGVTYASSDALGDGFVNFVGTGTAYDQGSALASTTYNFAIYSYKGTGSLINYKQVSPLTGSVTTLSGTDITEPFVNVNTTPTSVAKGAPVNVTVTFRDVESGIAEAFIYYAALEDAKSDYSNFVSGTMVKGTGENYTFTIPGTVVKEMGVTYYFYLKNGVGLTNYSSDYFTAVQVTGNGLTIPFTGFGTDQTKYRIVSIPVLPTIATADAVFGDDLGPYDKKSWRLFRYQGSTTELNGKSTLVVGNGYWLIASKSVALDTGPGTTSTVAVFDPFKLTFSPGWNQIGNPYPYDVKWQEILIWNGSPAGITKLRTYNGNWADGAELEKFSGGFVFNGGSTVTLEIPTIKDPSINGRVNSSPIAEVKNPIDGTDWSINLSLEQGGLTNTFGGVGMNSTAAEGYDRFDDFNLPRFTDFVEMNHLGKELHRYSYSKDVVPYQENHTWDFSIESNLKESVTMKWDNSFFGDNSKQLVLWDVSLQRGFDMRKINHYIFNAASSGHFKVFYGEANYIKEKTVVEQLVFHEVFPNPASDKVIISFSVPSEERVTIEVVDLLGRKVATIADGNFKTGYHEVQWNTQDHSGNAVTNGIYITQIKSLRSDQQKRLIINK